MTQERDPRHYDSYNPTFEEVVEKPDFNNIFFYLSQKYNIPGYLTDNRMKYHYTNAAGLLGIVESNRLWATDINFLNDPSEGSFFSDSIFKLMTSAAKEGNKTHEAILNALSTHLKNPSSDAGIFSVSFCDNGDLLSQWRAYGSFGGGYAIGLKIQTPGFRPWIAYKVNYSTKGLDEIGSELLNLCTSVIAKNGISIIDEMASELSNVLATISVSFKNEAYDEEKETRIVTVRSHNAGDEFDKLLPIKFRTRNSDVIPYIPLGLALPDNDVTPTPKLPIEEIVLGPGVDAGRDIVSIKRLLEMNGYGHVVVRASTIPFRP